LHPSSVQDSRSRERRTYTLEDDAEKKSWEEVRVRSEGWWKKAHLE